MTPISLARLGTVCTPGFYEYCVITCVPVGTPEQMVMPIRLLPRAMPRRLSALRHNVRLPDGTLFRLW